MQRHLRLCLGRRFSQQAEGYMELLDPGAGGFMDNGYARAPQRRRALSTRLGFRLHLRLYLGLRHPQ